MVKMALALVKGILSYAPAALGSACSTSLALESSIIEIACGVGGIATAVPAWPVTARDFGPHVYATISAYKCEMRAAVSSMFASLILSIFGSRWSIFV